ncbi:EAL domain-containing protein [Anaerosinus gibii]|uniref:EAL domain-containing protein n=1 Tax=Selenobaculum gibii TaxID=3054208 RepID=A0A9Y2AIY1_9FIRM|nr:EAL domain-containing protein [Selenobaculum gbiensis]WIW71172.1 EAL domain-containing protein [Selenobaculum gbiensis]
MNSKRESAGRHINYIASNEFYIDDTFVQSIIELLFFSRNINSTIQTVLMMLSEYYDAPYVNIVEEISKQEGCITTYEYKNSRIDLKMNKVLNLNHTVWIRYQELFNQQGLFSFNLLADLQNDNADLYNFIQGFHLKSTLQCAIFENGIQQGFIALYDRTSNRKWSQIELNTFAVISKILSAYLLKLRLSEINEKNLWIDPLTGIWNLTKFTMEANAFLAKKTKQKYVVIYVDIRKFKFINDVYGYAEGDRVLVTFARLLKSSLYRDEMFARVTSDHFICLARYDTTEKLVKRFKNFATQMNNIKKNCVEQYKILLNGGVCLVDPNIASITSSIDKANIARKAIKGQHKSMYNFYNAELKQQLAKEKSIEDHMEEALQNDEFVVYYQPKIELLSNKMVGAEALVRWCRPNYGLVPPDEFIPIFEKNGFIVEMDFHVFEKVCKSVRKWLDQNLEVVPISVNFSRVHLKTSLFIDRLVEVADKYQIPRGLIELELTESAFIENADALLTLFNQLKDLRFMISLDDFGTGFSALKLLTELPVDVLKLDKDFLKKGQTTKREQIVLEHVIRMSKDLDIKVVSEGVETEEQAKFLTRIGCNLAQGYLFSKPMPESDFLDRLRAMTR